MYQEMRSKLAQLDLTDTDAVRDAETKPDGLSPIFEVNTLFMNNPPATELQP